MFRKTVSLTGLLSFALLLITSVVLYCEPHGRVAYWTDWRLLGLSKDQWDALHLSLGTLFLLSGLLHIRYNWKAVTNYLRNRTRELVILTPPLVAALLVTLYFTLGALVGLPGVRQILDFGAYLKQSHGAADVNPPYGHAELSSLDDFAQKMGFDAAAARETLRSNGLSAEPGETLREIADRAGKTPRQLYALIRAGLGGDPFAALPPRAPAGTGRMTLAQFCAGYGLPPDAAEARLRRAGLKPEMDTPFKVLAGRNGLTPQALYQTLRTGERP